MAKKKTDEVVEQSDAVEGMEAAEVVEAVETAANTEAAEEVAAAEEAPKRTAKKAKAEETAASTEADGDERPVHKGKRAEKIGVVTSDKMTLTVVVRVDRLVKHPIYRKYVKKRKKFMAHDDKGAKIGDKVRIVETRPLSARKRWRVVEIIQKAEL
jgi:small subunit ribosomal protein S17